MAFFAGSRSKQVLFKNCLLSSWGQICTAICLSFTRWDHFFVILELKPIVRQQIRMPKSCYVRWQQVCQLPKKDSKANKSIIVLQTKEYYENLVYMQNVSSLFLDDTTFNIIFMLPQENSIWHSFTEYTARASDRVGKGHIIEAIKQRSLKICNSLTTQQNSTDVVPFRKVKNASQYLVFIM